MCYISSLPIVTLLSYIAYRFDVNKNVKKYISLVMSFGVGTVGYAAMMLVLYATMIGADSNSELSNYARYMSTYIIAEFLFVGILIVMNIAQKYEDSINVKNILLALGIMIVLIDSKQLSVFMPSALITKIDTPYEEMCATINANTNDNDSVYLIGKNSSDYLAIVQYLSNGVDIRGTYESEVNIVDVMKCDYVWVMKDNNLSKKDFEIITGIKNPSPEVLYKIKAQ
jgi:hypothetical protein